MEKKLLTGTIGCLLYSIPLILQIFLEFLFPSALSSYIYYIVIYLIIGSGLILWAIGFYQWNEKNYKVVSIIAVILSISIAFINLGVYIEKNYVYNKYYQRIEAFLMGKIYSYYFYSRLIPVYIAYEISSVLAVLTIIYGYVLITKSELPNKKLAKISAAILIEYGIMALILTSFYVNSKIFDHSVGVFNAGLYFLDEITSSVIDFFMMFKKGPYSETLYNILSLGGFFPVAVGAILYAINFYLQAVRGKRTNTEEGKS